MSGSSPVQRHRGSGSGSSPHTPLLGTAVTMKVLAPEIRHAMDYVNRGVGVRLSGLPLSGRSELLRAIGETLKEQGQPVVQINGNPALRAAPFGALVAAGLAKEPHPRFLGEVTAELDRRFSTEPPVVLCDDPTELDDWTVGALHSVLNSRRIPLVTTMSTRREQVQGHPFFSLGPAVDLPLAPMHLDQLQLLASAVLGGPLGPVSLLKVARASGGLFGLALSICTLCQASGQTRTDSLGHYRITGELWSPEFSSLAVKLTVGASDEMLRHAARLAQCGPLTLSEAEALIGSDALTELQDVGMVQRAEQNGTAITWVSAGLLADFLRHEFAGSESVTEPWGPADDHTITTTGLIRERILHEARQRARDARQAWQDAPSAEHALPLLIALQQAEAPVEQIRDVIERTTRRGPGAPLTLFLQWAIEWLCSHDAETAARRLAETRGPVGPALHEALDILIRSLRMEPLPELPLPRLPDEDRFGQELLRDAEIRIALLRGKNETAARLLSRWRPTLPSVQLSVQALTLLNASFGSDVAGAAEEASQVLRSIPRTLGTNPAIEILGYTAVLSLYQAGRMHEAWAIAQDLVSAHPRSSDTFRNGITSLGARIARLEGQELLAMAWAMQEDATAISMGPLPGMVGGLLRTALDPTLDPEDCAAGFWRVAAGLIKRGYVANGLLTACWALDRGKGPAAVVKQIEALQDDVESPLLKVMIRIIVAAHLADTDGMAGCVRDFAGLGAAMLATKAEVVLALTLRRRGDLPAAAAAASAAWQRAVETGHDSRVIFSPLVRSLGLTLREREIVQLLSQGMTYTEIAEALGLGAGTVDTHLVNIAHKVGAPTRAHLVGAAATWLRLCEPEPTWS